MPPARSRKRGRSTARKKEKRSKSGDIKEEITEQEPEKAPSSESDEPEAAEIKGKTRGEGKKPAKRGKMQEEADESDEPEDEEPKKKRTKRESGKARGNKRTGRGKKTMRESSTEPSEGEAGKPKGSSKKRRGKKTLRESSTEPSEGEAGKPRGSSKKGRGKKTMRESSTDSSEDEAGKPRGSNKRGRGKKTMRASSTESSEDEAEMKQVKKKVATPRKKTKKGEDTPVPRPIKYESLGDGPPSVPSTGRKYMGSHVSAAGGIWNAFENAEECSSKSFAIFLRNQRQWNAKALDEETVEKWKEAGKDFAPHLILPHGSYLMNLGSPVPETLEKSRAMLVDELQRCQRLGIPHYNFHPGSTTGKISREECCKMIAESINIAHSQTKGVICVLENMSRQGFTIGGDLHELRLIIEHVKDKTRVGICLDTCHSHAAGYDLSLEEGFEELLEDFEKIIGWQFLRGLHINDSKGKAGDHLDRHENIGRGTIGLDGFRRVMNCDHFNDLPLILETPWTSNAGYASEVKKLESIIKK